MASPRFPTGSALYSVTKWMSISYLVEYSSSVWDTPGLATLKHQKLKASSTNLFDGNMINGILRHISDSTNEKCQAEYFQKKGGK